MRYMKIKNLYSDKRVLLFKKVWATEKIHGTSAWIIYTGHEENKRLLFHPGGYKHDLFIALFDQDKLLKKCTELFGNMKVKLHGEHYGGKIQRMKDIYGDTNDFILFDIKIGDCWLSFDKVQSLAEKLELPIVHGVIVNATVKKLDEQRDAPSELAKIKGLGDNKQREGIVIHPLEEMTLNNGERLIAKHKGENFRETTTKREISDKEIKLLTNAQEVAEEWVTPMRLNHVLDKFPDAKINQMREIINAMVDDVKIESENEVVWMNQFPKAIAKRTAFLFKQHLNSLITD